MRQLVADTTAAASVAAVAAQKLAGLTLNEWAAVAAIASGCASLVSHALAWASRRRNRAAS